MTNAEIQKFLEEMAKEFNLSNEDIKEILKLSRVMFCGLHKDKGE